MTVTQSQINVAQQNALSANAASVKATQALESAQANPSTPANVITSLGAQSEAARSQADFANLNLQNLQAQYGSQLANQPSGVAPNSSQAPQVTDPTTGQIVTNYAAPTQAQKTDEAANKIATQGSVPSFTNVTQGVAIKTANGNASAVNVASGQTVANLGAVAPTSNTIPPNTLPISSSDRTTALKVTITQQPSITGIQGDPGNQVVFTVMPTISETRDANYKSFTPIQHPGEILKYEGSTSRSWSIQAKLVSRNVVEADQNLKYINLIRSWVMPFYGTGTGTPGTPVTQYLGSPPPVLTLKAYGNQMIGPVSCVLLNYNWNWPNEVDWIPTSSGVPFPVMVDVSINMKESFSPAEYSAFDILAYRNGNMRAAFGGASTSQASTTGSSTPNSATAPTSPAAPLNPATVDTSQATNVTRTQINGANVNASATNQSANTGTSATLTANQSSGSQITQKVLSNG